MTVLVLTWVCAVPLLALALGRLLSQNALPSDPLWSAADDHAHVAGLPAPRAAADDAPSTVGVAAPVEPS